MLAGCEATKLYEIAHDRLPSDEWLGLRPAFEAPDDHRVGVVPFTKGVHIFGVPCFQVGSHGIDVLLRHRPRSIPQAQESA